MSHFLVAHLGFFFVEHLILLIDEQRRLLVSVIDHVLCALLARLFILDKAVAGGLVHGAEYLQLIIADLSQSCVSAALVVRNSIELLRFEAVCKLIRGLATFFLTRLRLQILEVLFQCLHRFDERLVFVATGHDRCREVIDAAPWRQLMSLLLLLR